MMYKNHKSRIMGLRERKRSGRKKRTLQEMKKILNKIINNKL